MTPDARPTSSRQDSLDWLTTHRGAGSALFLLTILTVFVLAFGLSRLPMMLVRSALVWLNETVGMVLPAGFIRDLLTEGVISGVGSVLVFLPPIFILFLCLAVLEDCGYMRRAASALDRSVGWMGLSGCCMLPLLCSFGCAVPGILAARTIRNRADRMVTILVAPFLCCSARWPVFFLIAGIVIPDRRLWGFLPLPSVVLFGLFVLGIGAALIMSRLLRHTLFRVEGCPEAMPLPPYRRPQVRRVLTMAWECVVAFLRKAGTVILVATVVMWFLSHYPQRTGATIEEQIRHSWAGQIGHAVEPIFHPLGFDWKISMAILSSYASREVFVSTMATLHGIHLRSSHDGADVQQALRQNVEVTTGQPFYTPLRGINIMLFYVFSMQCISTFVVVRQQAGHWKWAVFQWLLMTGVAWMVCFAVWQSGRWLGWG